MTDTAALMPRRCPICGCPSDYHGFGCMGSWAEPCDCNLTAEQVERMSADARRDPQCVEFNHTCPGCGNDLHGDNCRSLTGG